MFFHVKKGDQTLRFTDFQMNVGVLGKIFNLFPQSIYLTAKDGTVAGPDDSGEFDIYSMDGTGTWEVHGDNSKPEKMQPSTSSGSTYAFAANRPGASKWKPLSLKKNNPPPGVSRDKWSEAPKPKKGKVDQWMKNIEVCTIEDHEFKKTINLPVTFTESVANVLDVSDIVSEEAFNEESVVLLDVDNLRIPNIAGTKGSRFWKGTRKVKAVNEEEYNSFIRSSHQNSKPLYVPDSRESDDELFNIPLRDKGKGKASARPDETLTKRVDMIESTVGGIISDSTQKIADLTSSKSLLEHEVSALKKSLKKIRDGFICLVCKDLPTFPLFITPCCKIVTCKSCMERWLVEADDCPQCRAIIDRDNISSTCIDGFRALTNVFVY